MSRRLRTILVAAVVLAALSGVATGARAQGSTYSHRESRRLAERLGLGTRLAATLLLNGGFPESWSTHAGGNQPPGYLAWPVPGHRLGRGFGSGNGRHLAIDVAAERGTPAQAMAPGIVGYSDDEVKGYGNLVLLVHGDGWVTLYAHLDRFKVEPGQVVERGQAIGTIGNTGVSRGDHLHFALLVRGKPVDPLRYLRGVPQATPRLSRLLDTVLGSALARRTGRYSMVNSCSASTSSPTSTAAL
jgi:murein DD-endopeptidase MepM/ murein hydrolase activator NlpD